MKIMLLILGVFIIISFSFATCESKCWGKRCSDPINFKLVNKLTQQDLVSGANPKYHIDSMQLNRLPDFNLGIYNINFLSRVYGDINGLSTSTGVSSVDTSYLRLTSTDIDTLVISYLHEEKDCCGNFGGYGKIVSIKYNGQVAMKDGINYKFEKQ